MKKVFQSSVNIIKSLFNSIVNLSLALENLSQALLVKSELQNIELQHDVLEKLENKDEILASIHSQQEEMRHNSKRVLISLFILLLAIIIIF